MYVERDDRRFGNRVIGAMLLCAVPLGLVGLAGVMLQLPLPLFLGFYGVTLAVMVMSLILGFQTTKCPTCGQKIRVAWNSQEFRRGGMLKYTCDHCRIIWLTHVFPGSDV
jgi:hypothetical protein